jgi:hypothetical protein
MTRISRRDFASRSAALAIAGMSVPGWMSLAEAAATEGAAAAPLDLAEWSCFWVGVEQTHLARGTSTTESSRPSPRQTGSAPPSTETICFAPQALRVEMLSHQRAWSGHGRPPVVVGEALLQFGVVHNGGTIVRLRNRRSRRSWRSEPAEFP